MCYQNMRYKNMNSKMVLKNIRGVSRYYLVRRTNLYIDVLMLTFLTLILGIRVYEFAVRTWTIKNISYVPC